MRMGGHEHPGPWGEVEQWALAVVKEGHLVWTWFIWQWLRSPGSCQCASCGLSTLPVSLCSLNYPKLKSKLHPGQGGLLQKPGSSSSCSTLLGDVFHCFLQELVLYYIKNGISTQTKKYGKNRLKNSGHAVHFCDKIFS